MFASVLSMQRWEVIAQHITEATERPKLTKAGIASWLGISRTTLNRRLDGKSDWPYEDVIAVAQLLGTTVEQLTENGTSTPSG